MRLLDALKRLRDIRRTLYSVRVMSQRWPLLGASSWAAAVGNARAHVLAQLGMLEAELARELEEELAA